MTLNFNSVHIEAAALDSGPQIRPSSPSNSRFNVQRKPQPQSFHGMGQPGFPTIALEAVSIWGLNKLLTQALSYKGVHRNFFLRKAWLCHSGAAPPQADAQASRVWYIPVFIVHFELSLWLKRWYGSGLAAEDLGEPASQTSRLYRLHAPKFPAGKCHQQRVALPWDLSVSGRAEAGWRSPHSSL